MDDDADGLDIRRMLGELDFPVGDADRTEMLRHFADTLDPISDLLQSLELRTDGHPQQRFGIVHLLTRSVSDLLAGGHLAAHCYVVQAYCVLRPVLDSCDLIELFAQDPEEATSWATTTRAHAEFAPARVRERLGRERHDPVHGHFSESGSHARFAGAQLSGGMVVAPDDLGDMTALFRMGPMWSEHSSTLLVWPFALQGALQLSYMGHHLLPLAVDAEAAVVSWLEAYLASLDGATAGVGRALDLPGVSPDSPMRWSYAEERASVVAQLAERAG